THLRSRRNSALDISPPRSGELPYRIPPATCRRSRAIVAHANINQLLLVTPLGAGGRFVVHFHGASSVESGRLVIASLPLTGRQFVGNFLWTPRMLLILSLPVPKR